MHIKRIKAFLHTTTVPFTLLMATAAAQCEISWCCPEFSNKRAMCTHAYGLVSQTIEFG